MCSWHNLGHSNQSEPKQESRPDERLPNLSIPTPDDDGATSKQREAKHTNKLSSLARPSMWSHLPKLGGLLWVQHENLGDGIRRALANVGRAVGGAVTNCQLRLGVKGEKAESQAGRNVGVFIRVNRYSTMTYLSNLENGFGNHTLAFTPKYCSASIHPHRVVLKRDQHFETGGKKAAEFTNVCIEYASTATHNRDDVQISGRGHQRKQVT